MEIVLFLVGLFVGAGLVYFIMRKSSVSFADMEKKQREIVELKKRRVFSKRRRDAKKAFYGI